MAYKDKKGFKWKDKAQYQRYLAADQSKKKKKKTKMFGY